MPLVGALTPFDLCATPLAHRALSTALLTDLTSNGIFVLEIAFFDVASDFSSCCFNISLCLGDSGIGLDKSFGLPSLSLLIPLTLPPRNVLGSWRSTCAGVRFGGESLRVFDRKSGLSPNFVWTFSGIAAVT